MEGAVLPAKSNYGEAALWVGWVAERANHLDGWRSFGEKPVASGFRRQALDEALQVIRVTRLRDTQERRGAITQHDVARAGTIVPAWRHVEWADALHDYPESRSGFIRSSMPSPIMTAPLISFNHRPSRSSSL